MTCDIWNMTYDTCHVTNDMWHLTHDMWHATHDTWHMTCNTWHVTHYMGHMVGGELSLKVSALQLLWFSIDSVLKSLNKRITELIKELINEWRRCLKNSCGPCQLLWVVRVTCFVHCTMYSVQYCLVYLFQHQQSCTMGTWPILYVLWTVIPCWQYIVQYTPYSVHCTLYTVHCTLLSTGVDEEMQ